MLPLSILCAKWSRAVAQIDITLVMFQQRAAFLTAWWVDAEIALSAIEGKGAS